jgi:hypothetical protein
LPDYRDSEQEARTSTQQGPIKKTREQPGSWFVTSTKENNSILEALLLSGKWHVTMRPVIEELRAAPSFFSTFEQCAKPMDRNAEGHMWNV